MLQTDEAKIEKSAVADNQSPGTRRSLGTTIIRNVMFGALRYLLLVPIPFVLTPLILHKIGAAGYGTWAIFLAINSMTSLADFGLVGTLSKFVAEYHAQADFAALNRLLNSGLAMFVVLAATVATVVGGAAPLLIRYLARGSTTPALELAHLLRCFVVLITANTLILLFSSITTGLQRLDLTYAMSAANILLSAALSVAFLLRGWGLTGLIYAYITGAVVTTVVYMFLVRKLLPGMSWNPLGFHLQEARKMVSFSLRLYTIQAAVAIHNQIDKIFLAVLIGVAPAGWFDIASDTALKVRSVVGLVLGPVLPAASELNALQDERRIEELYFRTHKYLALFGVPIVFAVALFAGRFVDLWLGPAMAVIAFPMALLVAVNFVNLASGPAFLLFAGSGYLRPAIRSSLLGIGLDIVLSLVLIHWLGFAGAAVGTSLSLLIAAVYLTWTFHRQHSYSFRRLLRESYLKPVACSVLSLAATFAAHSVHTLSWYGLIAMGLMFAGIYALLILLSGFFDSYDWNKIEIFLPAARHARRNWQNISESRSV
jgi:O-antigen/teichoic acid export membrane protein